MVDKLVSHLSLAKPGRLRPGRDVPGLEVARVPDPQGVDLPRVRRLHDTVATPHLWSSLARSDEDWTAAELADRVHLVATLAGQDVGWACLAPDDDGVRIAFFGLIPDALGRGLGGALLTEAVRAAWREAEARKIEGPVWLRTSSWDHPHALANYRARGFDVVRLVLETLRPGTSARDRTVVDAPPRLLVRPAVALDAPHVGALLDHLGYRRTEQEVAARLRRAASSPDDVVAVVTLEGQIVGVVAAHVVPLLAEEDDAFVRITALSVAPEAARLGVGLMLVEFVEHAGWQRGARTIEVSSGRRDERAAAHAFYRALGFEDAGTTAVRYRKGIMAADAGRSSR